VITLKPAGGGECRRQYCQAALQTYFNLEPRSFHGLYTNCPQFCV